MSDYYDGAGDGQCLAIKKNDGKRCTNGVHMGDYCCGIHKLMSGVTFAPETDDRDWFSCPGCGWQPADYAGPGTGVICSHCGVKFPVDAAQWSEHEDTDRDGGGQA